MRKLIIILMMVLCSVANARTITSVKDVNGNILHSLQAGWVIVDEELSAGTEPDALGLDERSLARVKTAIATDSGDDGEITIFPVPANWNSVRFRSINITIDSGNVIYEVYLGSLGTPLGKYETEDCDLVYVGQLDFTSGKQESMYQQITFTSGGTYIPQVGDVVTGNTSGKTAVVVKVPAAATNSFATADATGTIQYRSFTGTFTNSETVKIGDGKGDKANVLTHAASDLVPFYYADTLVTTAKSTLATWGSQSPADDTAAEAELDVRAADIMVIVASTCTADAKLLCKGY